MAKSPAVILYDENGNRVGVSTGPIVVHGSQASGTIPIPVVAGVTGTISISNFPNNQGVTGSVGVIGPVGVTGSVGMSGVVGVIGPVGITGSVSIDNFPTNQGITGSVGVIGPVGITGPVLVLQGTATSLSNAWPVKVTDGITSVSVKAASVSATGTDQALVVAVSPNNTIATTNSIGSQVDGHSLTIGTTTDADSSNTVIGRLKQIITKLSGGLPASLLGGRLDTNIGSWLGSTVPTIGQKANASSIPISVSSDQVGSLGSAAPSQGFPLAAKQNSTTTLRALSAKLDSVDNEYRLLVDAKSQIVPPVPPPSTTPRTIVPSGSLGVSGNSTDTHNYVIPNGVTFTIQQVVTGAEGDPNERGSKVTVYYVDASSTTHVVQRIYLQSTTVQVTPETSQAVDGTSMVGDGSTTQIRIDRTRLGGGTAEIDAVVRGYES